MTYKPLALCGDIIAIRGAGDIATGVAQKFYRAGMRVVLLEAAEPTAIRRTVSLSPAVTDGRATVEDMTARLVTAPSNCAACWAEGVIPVLVDPCLQALPALAPDGLIDAILAKQNLGTHAGLAPVVIALGPGFSAPHDAHAVIETMRGHTLGRVIFQGSALPDTGTPGLIGGRAVERVLRAPADGTLRALRAIGDIVQEGKPIFSVKEKTVSAPFSGVLRGILPDGAPVQRDMKSADIDPRVDSDWRTISDKARCVAGGALEAYLCLKYRAEASR